MYGHVITKFSGMGRFTYPWCSAGALRARSSAIKTYSLDILPCETIASIFAYFKNNALLATAVHVKMKLGDNTLNNERLSLVMMKLPIKN